MLTQNSNAVIITGGTISSTNINGTFIENIQTNMPHAGTTTNLLDVSTNDWFQFTLTNNNVIRFTNWNRGILKGQTISLLVSNPSDYNIWFTNGEAGNPIIWPNLARSISMQSSPTSSSVFVFQIFGTNWRASAVTNF